MNIFYLNSNPQLAAQDHIDRHVVKMILETAQLLSTAHRVVDGHIELTNKIDKRGKSKSIKMLLLPDKKKDVILYKATHINHPCAIWARDSINNYMWLYELFVALCDEYTHRYGKIHKTDALLRSVLSTPPTNIRHADFSPPPQAMPEKYKNENAVFAYQNYYVGEKIKFASWKSRKKPDWFSNLEVSYANV